MVFGDNMTLSEKKENSVKKMPLIESQILKSKDGKYLIHKTIITHIKPIQYWQAVIESDELAV